MAMLFSVACPTQTGNTSEPDWFSTLNEVPLIFGRRKFDEDAFLISNTHNFTYGCGIGQYVCDESNPCLSSCERVAKHEVSLGSDEAKGYTLRAPVPGRARSKRHRPGTRTWSTGLLLNCNSPTNTLDSTTDPSNNTTTATTTCITKHHSVCQSEVQSTVQNEGLEANATTYIRTTSDSPSTATAFYNHDNAWKIIKFRKTQETLQPRRCAHCQTQKTPQWRAGPTGPKALCNACGVRYKSGRLFPEYRPARSPTFSTHEHSNSHKKVMEMRVQKKTMVDLLLGKGDDIQVKLNPSQCARGFAGSNKVFFMGI